MDPLPKSSWWVRAPLATVNADPEQAVLVVRLGLAVNALRAQHRWTASLARASTAVEQSDFLLSFVTAASITREALNILTGTGPTPGEARRVRELATAAGVAPALSAKLGQLMGGGHRASTVLTRVRNQLGFHWDPTLLGTAIVDAANDPVVWEEGRTRSVGESVYRLASDTLANAILPGMSTLSDEEARLRFADALRDVVDAMDTVAEYFSLAIAGYLMDRNPVLETRWHHKWLELARKGSLRLRAVLTRKH